ncbi:hypothetical protein Pst134EA_025455 [Puccinia striiformis f. sp. tritici]|uniref:ubiquitinyl hydrolase 1 n=1 Tax=Puccinia striiformis f. sp. tritici PST-78 TaxID=1165861 RepID=A0A0L0W0T1_9BASI|nr:hypothetical protein Pst134EA_025455 [Puccinia striiformis f. sp. tritici]KAH9451501.1 hypothetical protein Pst134EA_025455 [Puccinia striiformis f. sp. tritici]KNF05138.1 hypothetical protein PSTG_01767 [Puccinia striiformis f. sp. tritici PST-78]
MEELKPSAEEQARLYHSFRSTRMNINQTWYLIHQEWFKGWSDSVGIPNPSDSPAQDLGPIDNSGLLDENLQLRFGISIGIDCEIVPEQFWNLLVSWYGIKDQAHSIPRPVIAPSGPSSESVEFYPPQFIFHLLLPTSNLSELDSERFDLSGTDLPQSTITSKFSIGNSVEDLKTELINNLFPHNLLSRSFKLWAIHDSPDDPNQLILTTTEFERLERELVAPTSGDSADLNEALLTEPVNRLAIEQQDLKGDWLIDPIKKKTFLSITSTTNDVDLEETPSTPPAQEDQTIDPSAPVFGGQEWLDRMEQMNQANSLDPKFKITSPDLSLVAFASAQSALRSRGIRGLVGLTNLGNTCFMNSALQCLSNSPELKTYFLSRVYINELNRTNPLGMGGKVAETFGQLIERMWSSEYELSRKGTIKNTSSTGFNYNSGGNNTIQSISPREFKSIVGRFNSLFLGYGQQDSQELLTFLLDALHEDLNRVKVKPFDEIPDYDDNHPSDDPIQEAQKILKLAKTCWDLYRRRNDSVIVDLFQGQYKSTLICPDCNKVAIKFDEIMYLTLQLPINKKFKGTIYFVPLDISKPRMKVVYQLNNKDSTIRQLKQHIGQILGMDPNRMAAVEDWSGKPWKIWYDTDSLEAVLERDVINLFETPLPFAALKSGVYHTNGTSEQENEEEQEEPADLLIPVVSYRPTERTNLASGSSSSFHKPSHSAFGVFFVARISAKDRMSTRTVYDAVVREYSRYTTEAADLFESCEAEDEDVEMKDVGAENEPGPQRRAKPNLFKISVPKVPTSTIFPISSSMGNTTIELEERAKLASASSKPPLIGPVAMPTTTTDNESMNVSSSSNGTAMFETDENEDLYEDKNGKKPIASETESSPTITEGPVVFEGDYFECEWSLSSMGHFFGIDKTLPNSQNWIDPPLVEDPELVASRVALENSNKKPGELTIEECFKDFSKPEKLGEEDKWYCPRCKNHVQATKQMQIWKVPDILVVHFKRFSSARTSYGRSTKVDNFVDFPIRGLDLSNQVEGIKVKRQIKNIQNQRKLDRNHVDNNDPATSTPQIKIDDSLDLKNDSGVEIDDAIQEDQNEGEAQPELKLENEKKETEDDDDDDDEEEESLIYDLFAVDNHFGGLGGGHYTAFAKNEEDGKWHNYDDSHVTEVSSPEKVKSSAAYLLFYRRRTSRKLGLKTHGIVSSAMQSRDISVSPSVCPSVSNSNSNSIRPRDEGEEEEEGPSRGLSITPAITGDEEEEEGQGSEEGVVGSSVGRDGGSIRSQSSFSDDRSLLPPISRPDSSLDIHASSSDLDNHHHLEFDHSIPPVDFNHDITHIIRTASPPPAPPAPPPPPPPPPHV